MNLENGDQFERENADWIRQNLPTYETLWREFIGNDGKAHPLEMTGLSRERILARKRFYQAHYSMAQSAKKIVDIVASLEDVILKEEDTCQGQFDLLFCLLSRIGHVRDMIAKMDDALEMRGVAVNPLQEFYDLRSHVTHGPQMPFLIKNNIIQIPMIGRRNPTESEWDDQKAWEQMNPATFTPLSKFCDETVKEFFEILTSIHQKIYSAAKIQYKGCKLADSKTTKSSSSRAVDVSINTSTATTTYSACNISGKYWG
jgi:hypothetical protein